MIPGLLGIMIAFSITASAVLEVALTNLTVTSNNVKSQQAFNLAEAGLNYYMWHLNHNATDYKDGNTTPATPNAQLGYGPYIHNYVDANNVDEGTYTLWINPAGNGSTIVTVTSIGQATGSGITRTVQAKIGSPSFASYGVVANSALWFGNDEAADGPVDSNVGVRMDGPSDSTISSANTTYVPSTASGGNGSTSENGVWCSASVTTPVNCNTRNKSDWIYPAPQINFNQVSSSLCTMKKAAFAANASTASLATQSNACTQVPSTLTSSYLPQRSTTYSLTRGYLIVLNPTGTYNLYDVNAENDENATYSSALTTVLVATNVSIPSSGIIFAEDNVWVVSNPTYHGRVTIAAGRLTAGSSSSYANVVVAGPLLYSTKNGADTIGLVSQNSIIVAPYAPPQTGAFTFEIDGALLAEAGDVWYPGVYRQNANLDTRGWTASNQQLLFYGSVASNQTWTWNWEEGGQPCNGNASYDPVNGCISGIENTTTQYDYNLEYAPPPDYPLTSGYNILSWREVLTRP
jgi:Tfp pilus assembly protein PilX